MRIFATASIGLNCQSQRKTLRVWVHVSLMAEPALAAVGFKVVESEGVQIGDVSSDRAMMEKASSKNAD